MLDPRLLSVAVIWALNFAFVKFALTEFSPLSFTVARFAVSSLFLLVVMGARRESFRIERSDAAAVIWLGFIGIMMYNLLFMFGLRYTTASNSALFISASPLFAVLVLAVMKKQVVGTWTATGLLLSMAGVLCVLASKPGGLSLNREDAAGDLLTLCAALFWALYTILARPLVKKYSAIKITAYSMAAGALMLLPIGAGDLAAQQWTSVSAGAWGSFAFSTFLSGGLAFTLWYDGVRRLGVTRTVVYHYLVPLVAVSFAALFLRERIVLLQVIGGVMILSGVYVVQKSSTP
jgi:drug/metabolite transporter (DMT)-like permease